jgi:serine/threonine-protein kinase
MTAVVLWQMRSPLPAREAVRFVVNVPADAQAAPVAGMNTLALSPSGRVLVFTAIRSGTPVLFRRDLNQLAAEAIPGTEGGVQPFFSPDGQWVGFFDADDLSLKKVALAGGSPVTVQVIKAQLHGATWLGRQHHRVRKTPGSAGTRQRVRRRADAADDARRR